MGKIEAICTSRIKGTAKHETERVLLLEEHGIAGDAHAGSGKRQISILPLEEVDAFREKGANVRAGSFGENLVISGLDPEKIRLGARLRSGHVLLEVSQLGKECHSHCAIHDAMGECIMPEKGIFAKVLEGGTLRTGDSIEFAAPYRAAIITLSDKGAAGERTDESVVVIADRLLGTGLYEVVERTLLPDDKDALCRRLCMYADRDMADLILTTGGTGFSPRDVTPEATLAAADRMAPGIAEAIRAHSMKITPRAMLSRAVSVIRKNTLIINLPGSPKACAEALECILDTLPHGLDVLMGRVSDCARD